MKKIIIEIDGKAVAYNVTGLALTAFSLWRLYTEAVKSITKTP